MHFDSEGTQTPPKFTAASHNDEIFKPETLSTDDLSDAATIFEAFQDVTLDLTFSFSTQNSPATSVTEIPVHDSHSPPPLSSPSPSPSPPPPPPPALLSTPVGITPSTHTLSRTISFASQISPLIKTKKKFKSTKFSPEQSSSILRGSWPAIKYIGRGTPIDKSRRKEWSGISMENVAEDGLLFAPIGEARSLDSHPPRRLSSSSDWDFLNVAPGLSHSGSTTSPIGSSTAHGHTAVEEEEEEEGRKQEKEKEKERVLPLQTIEVDLSEETPEDWATAIQIVLSSTESDEPGEALELDATQDNTGEVVVETLETAEEDQGERAVQQEVHLPQEEIDKLQSELQLDCINVDKVLDLGFSPEVDGGALFKLTTVTETDSNPTIRHTVTVSSHSRYSTPSEGPPPDERPVGVLNSVESNLSPPLPVRGQQTPVARVFSDIRSITSTKADGCGSVNDVETKIVEETLVPWWKKALGRLKRVHQVLLRSHRNSY